MSNEPTPQVPARRDRREAVREKAALVQAQQRRGRFLRIGAIGVVAVALVAVASVGVAWAFISQSEKPQLSPAGLDGDAIVVDSVSASVLSSLSGPTDPVVVGGEVSASPTATPTPTASSSQVEIDVYVDYLSAEAATFQTSNAKQLTDWVDSGAATIAYHPVALLTAKSNGTKYSLRAAAAAGCVATHAPDSFFAFNHALLSDRPEPETDGLSDADLWALAVATGAEEPKKVRACIENGDFVSWAQQATARALAEPLGATEKPLTGPTVLVNGQPYVGALDDPKEFAQFVLTLASSAYYTSSTPTPTPTPTATPTETPAPAETPAG